MRASIVGLLFCASVASAGPPVARQIGEVYFLDSSALQALIGPDPAKSHLVAFAAKLDFQPVTGGLRLTGIDANSGFAWLAFHDGDVLRSLNGKPTLTTADLTDTFVAALLPPKGAWGWSQHFDFEILRQGKPLVVRYVTDERAAFGSDAYATASPAAADSPPPTVDFARGVKSLGGNRFEIERALVQDVLANPMLLTTSARFVPSIRDGKPNGFKVYALRPTSLYGNLGLQNGDTIKAVNGHPLVTPEDALAVYSSLRAAKQLEVEVERRGEPLKLEWLIR